MDDFSTVRKLFWGQSNYLGFNKLCNLSTSEHRYLEVDNNCHRNFTKLKVFLIERNGSIEPKYIFN